MKDDHLPCKCKACGRAWDEPQQLPMEMSVWLKKFKKLTCPTCGAGIKQIVLPFGDST
jgi:Zn finger protein HypA/HybF involved in hydrogenase expression